MAVTNEVEGVLAQANSAEAELDSLGRAARSVPSAGGAEPGEHCSQQAIEGRRLERGLAQWLLEGGADLCLAKAQLAQRGADLAARRQPSRRVQRSARGHWRRSRRFAHQRRPGNSSLVRSFVLRHGRGERTTAGGSVHYECARRLTLRAITSTISRVTSITRNRTSPG